MKPQACVVKGCPWRGHDKYGCPMHDGETSDAWDRQGQLMQGLRHATRRH